VAVNYTVSQKKLGHFYFYCNFVKCWPILIILSLSEPEIIAAVI